jgi:hypothetical protein
MAVHAGVIMRRRCSVTLSDIGNRLAQRYGYDFALRVMGYVKPEGDCWIWLGGRAGATDRPCVWNPWLQQSVYVSRMLLSIALDRTLRPGKLAGHRCDNGLCVNPLHLEEVTHSKNLADAYKRGRRKRPTTFV